MKAGSLLVGTDACMDLIQKRKVKLIIVANDAADRTKKNFEIACKNFEIPICFYGKIEDLSKAVGKPNKAIFGIKNQNFADEIEKLISGGEIIG
jgi:ribosomal protein L7Ae-like RNA K-turn-binding protein